MHRYSRLPALFLLIVMSSLAGQTRADGRVRVFVLAGQSNMVGAGQVVMNTDRNGGKGSLEWLTQDRTTASRFAHLIDEDGEWVSREDVQIWYLGRKGELGPGYGSNESTIGPELGFGCVVGDAFDEPVLLIKIAWGGKSLGRDFRPPSSGGEVGPYYETLIQTTKEVLDHAGTLFPDLADRDFELAGFGWHQGWNDRVNQELNDEYEENLANLIRDLRKDLGVPSLPFVIAETGMSGFEEVHPRALSLMAAQAAVPDREEFEGTTAFVGTRGFYRPPEESPSGQQYHWNSNAETYYLIGEGMGRAMVRLVESQQQDRGATPSPGASTE
jgi:hypothetical protein